MGWSWPEFGWLFALAATLHNLEEAVWLPRWSQQGGRWRIRVDAFEFRFAVLVLTVLAYGVAWLAAMGGPESIGAYALAGYALAMLLNVFFPHLWVTLASRRYAPGTATALLLNLPACSLLLYLELKDGAIVAGKVLLLGPAFVVALLAGIPLLFFLGRMIHRHFQSPSSSC